MIQLGMHPLQMQWDGCKSCLNKKNTQVRVGLTMIPRGKLKLGSKAAGLYLAATLEVGRVTIGQKLAADAVTLYGRGSLDTKLSMVWDLTALQGEDLKLHPDFIKRQEWNRRNMILSIEVPADLTPKETLQYFKMVLRDNVKNLANFGIKVATELGFKHEGGDPGFPKGSMIIRRRSKARRGFTWRVPAKQLVEMTKQGAGALGLVGE
jgi:hypothetical protein